MKITDASAAAIRYACKNYHYSGSVPAVQYGYNFYNDQNEWCGVICFSGGANKWIGSPYGMCQGEVLELVRVALNGKQTATSQCVAMALRELHRQDPLVRLIVSYADVDQGHSGTIYQATNWIYEGLKNKNTRSAFIVHGQKIHPRSAPAKGWKQSIGWLREHVDPNAEPWICKGKHKYLYCFDKKTRREILKIAQEYPK